MKIETGQQAPGFSLYNTEKTKVTLEDSRGKNVLLLFFPQAFTSVCTKELCGIRDNMSMYNNINAQVYGISVDSVFTLARFKEDQGLNFPLLSDFNREASRAYGVLYDQFVLEMNDVSKRAAFVLDREGTVQYAEVLESASDMPNFSAIHATLNQLN